MRYLQQSLGARVDRCSRYQARRHRAFVLEDTQYPQPALHIVYVRPDTLLACDQETEALILIMCWKTVEIHTNGKALLIIVTVWHLRMMNNLPSRLKRFMRTDSGPEICCDSRILKKAISYRSPLKLYDQRWGLLNAVAWSTDGMPIAVHIRRQRGHCI